MKQADALRGEVHIKFYEDGRMSLSIPNDPIIGYFMLHCGLDELQERTMKKKQEHPVIQTPVLVPKDGAHPRTQWGG